MRFGRRGGGRWCGRVRTWSRAPGIRGTGSA